MGPGPDPRPPGREHRRTGPAAAPPTPDGRGARPGLLQLQRLAGNRAVTTLVGVQRQDDAGGGVSTLLPVPLTNDPLEGTTIGDLTPPVDRPLLQFGSNGPDVVEMQNRLNQDGADPPLVPDGDFGGLTRTALTEFQRRHGLKVDAKCGRQTWGLLDELARAQIFGAHDVLEGTHAVSTEEAAAVGEHMLTTSPAPGSMDGAGNGQAFEMEVFAALDAYYAHALSQVRPAGEATTMDHAGEIGRLAQRLIDDFYNDHIVMASRPPGLNEKHPGSFRMPIADATTRNVDAEFARLWVELDIEFARTASTGGKAGGTTVSVTPPPSPQPGDVSAAHLADSRRPADKAEMTRVADKYLRSGRLATVISMIQTYPAEASSGTVFIQLRDPSFVGRRGMWDLLSGLMHEYLHLAAHPGYTQAAEIMGGTTHRVLIEGFCDYFREQAWNALVPRFESDVELRRIVEGEFFTLEADPAAIVPHETYDEIADARAIVAELDRTDPDAGPIPIGSAGGEANARVAYFMGHVHLLGIGPATAGNAPAGAFGTFSPDDAADDGIYIVASGGETLREVRDRTQATSVLDENGVGFVDDAHRFTAGSRLRVDGIRYVLATENDTRAQIANQNGIALAALVLANRLPPAPGDTPVRRGTRVLIPRHA